MTTKRLQKDNQTYFYYVIGFSCFNGECLTAGIAPVKSIKSTLTAVESLALVRDKLGFNPRTMISFTPISKEQFDTFINEEEDAKRKQKEYDEPPIGSSICIIQ